jgi:hypothetical protein
MTSIWCFVGERVLDDTARQVSFLCNYTVRHCLNAKAVEDPATWVVAIQCFLMISKSRPLAITIPLCNGSRDGYNPRYGTNSHFPRCTDLHRCHARGVQVLNHS